MNLYETVKAIAEKTVEAFLTDVTHHDQPYLNVMQNGDIALWQCRPCGSHLVTVRRYEINKPKPYYQAKYGLEFMDAIEQQAPGRQWYVIRATSWGTGTVKPVTAQRARTILNDERIHQEHKQKELA